MDINWKSQMILAIVSIWYNYFWEHFGNNVYQSGDVHTLPTSDFISMYIGSETLIDLDREKDIRVSIAALSVTVKNQKQPKCPSIV